MIREKVTVTNVIDIDGPDGNAFLLLSKAKKLSEEKGLDFEPISEQMKKGDYINLLKVFDKNFGDEIILETSNKYYLMALNN